MSTEIYKKPSFWAGVVACASLTYLVVRYSRNSNGAGASGGNSSGMTAKKLMTNHAISAQEFTPLTLQSVRDISHNTKMFRFGFKDAEQQLGLHVASCLLVKADSAAVKSRETGQVEMKPVIRPYTPVSERDVKGHVDLVIKSYPDGAMSQHLFKMHVGDTLGFKGPLPKLPYEANKYSHVGMLAGGTGLTPMLQVVREILGNKTDKTKVTLLFANVSQSDILLKDELDLLAAKHPHQFTVNYTIDKADKDAQWTGFTGHVDATKYEQAQLPKKDEHGSIVLVCGPPGFMKAMSGDKMPDKSQGEVAPESLLGKLGFTAQQVYKF